LTIDFAEAANETSAMDSRAAVGIAVVAALVLLRYFAARRVAARQGQFVWLAFVPTLIGAVVILWTGVQMLATMPVVGVVIMIAGGIYLAVALRFLSRLSRSVTAAGPEDDVGAAMTESLVDYMSTIMGLLLIAGLVALVGLIVWGVSQAAR
jgi:amino acid transporter